MYVCIRVCTLEMQQYIDISQYRDTLGSDTVSIYQIFDVSPSNCIHIHTTDAVVVHYGCKFTALQPFIAYNFRKSSKNQLIRT